jgi:hypothetical protein
MFTTFILEISDEKCQQLRRNESAEKSSIK